MNANLPTLIFVILMWCGCASQHHCKTIAEVNHVIAVFNEDGRVLEKISRVARIDYSIQNESAVCRDKYGNIVVVLKTQPDGKFIGALRAEVGGYGEGQWMRFLEFPIEGKDLR